jgi:hypothetical protein
VVKYTRVYVWLNTKPDKSEYTRKERFEFEGIEIIYPEIKCEYLFIYLLKIGAVSNNGMGAIGLTWHEINAWKQATGVPLNAWELEVIHKASDAYASQLSISRNFDCPMPERILQQDPVKLARHIKSILR